MTGEQRKELEERLRNERARREQVLRQFDEDVHDDAENAGELTNYPLHPADRGTDTMEEEKDLALMSQEARQLYEIDEALRRLVKEPERFGKCEVCGREIDFERLALVPWTRWCREHAESQESTTAG